MAPQASGKGGQEPVKKILYGFQGFLGCLLLIALFLGIQRLTYTKIRTWDASVTAGSFSEDIYSIKETDFRVFDWALYTPEDFAAFGTDLPSGEAPATYQDARAQKDVSEYYRSGFARFHTAYLALHLEPGQTYGIHVENASYAMRLWVDGRLLAQNGTVSDTPEGFVPLTRSNTVYFTATGDRTAIVMQRANFNHTYWNTAVLKLGSADLIEAMVQKQLLGVCLTIITLLTTSLINLGMFFYSPGRAHFLFFSLACAFIAIRHALTDPKPIMLLFPNLNWYFGHRLEHGSFILTVLFLLLFYYSIFKKLLPKILPVISVALSGFMIGAYLVLPSLSYTRYSYLFQILAIIWLLVFFSWTCYAVVRGRKDLSAFQWTTWFGEILFLLSTGADRLSAVYLWNAGTHRALCSLLR